MDGKITLDEALGRWSTWKGSQASSGEHIAPEELFELLVHPLEIPGREQLLTHLTRCAACLGEFQVLVESREAAGTRLERWDLALPRAAASPIEGPRRIFTEGRKYTIVIRPHVSDTSRGLITVQVAPQHQQALEGETLRLLDGQGRVVLEGRVTNGEVAQEVADIEAIETTFFVSVPPA